MPELPASPYHILIHISLALVLQKQFGGYFGTQAFIDGPLVNHPGHGHKLDAQADDVGKAGFFIRALAAGHPSTEQILQIRHVLPGHEPLGGRPRPALFGVPFLRGFSADKLSPGLEIPTVDQHAVA